MIGTAWGCSAVLSASIMFSGKSGNFPRCTFTSYTKRSHSKSLRVAELFVVAACVFFCFKLLHYTTKAGRKTDILKHARQTELRLQKTIAVIVAVLASVWLTCFCLYWIRQLFEDTPEVQDLIQVWGNVLVQLNSFVNPFIYTWRSKAFRTATVALFPRRETLPCWRVNSEPAMELGCR